MDVRACTLESQLADLYQDNAHQDNEDVADDGFPHLSVSCEGHTCIAECVIGMGL